jgi:hypothetical protein
VQYSIDLKDRSAGSFNIKKEHGILSGGCWALMFAICDRSCNKRGKFGCFVRWSLLRVQIRLQYADAGRDLAIVLHLRIWREGVRGEELLVI